MKSNIRVFYKKGYLKNYLTERDNILPFEKFRLFPDLDKEVPNEKVGKYLVGKAEEYLKMDIPLLPLSLFRDFWQTQNRSRFEGKYELRRNMLIYMSLAEAYEKKGRFIERIVDVLWAIMEESTWTLPAHTGHSPEYPRTDVPDAWREDQIPALDLQNAQTASLLTLVYYLHRDTIDAINPIICEKLKYLVYMRTVRAYLAGQYIWSGDTKEGFIDNWLTNITSCVLFVTAVTVSDMGVRKRIVERAMHRLDNYTANLPEDGYCDEGPGYWGGAGGNLFDCLEIIDAMSGGKLTVYDAPIIKNLGEYIAKFNIDGNYYLNFSDARPRAYYDGRMMMRYGLKCGSEELYSFGKMLSFNLNPDSHHFYYAHSYRELHDFLTPSVTEAESVLGKRAVYFENNSVAIFRESVVTSEGLYLATKGGTNAEMHNHNDVGCLVVYSDGKPVIVDPSHGSYNNGFFGPTRYDRWFMKSSYHSIPTVDGIEQRAGAEFSASDASCDLDNQTVTMNLAGAFPKEAGVRRMQRTCKLEDGVITVTDEVEAEREADIRFNFVLVDKPEIKEDGILALGEGRTFTYDTSLKLEIEKVENTYLPYDDLDFQGSWGRDCLWRIVLSAKGKNATSVITIR